MAMEDINEKFDAKVQELEEKLPQMPIAICVETTLASVLDILGIDNYLFHNLAIPLAGGLSGFTSYGGWRGACGVVTGGCAAIGVIVGGHEKMDMNKTMKSMSFARKYAAEYEREFGSVVCQELCGFDWSAPNTMKEYIQSGTWVSTCYKHIVWAVDMIRKLTAEDLETQWEKETEDSAE